MQQSRLMVEGEIHVFLFQLLQKLALCSLFVIKTRECLVPLHQGQNIKLTIIRIMYGKGSYPHSWGLDLQLYGRVGYGDRGH